MLNQRVIPAIYNHKKMKIFLESDLKYGILMNFQLAQLEELVKVMKKNNKKILIHSELIKGLSSDEYGAIYLIQSLHVDGIISSKPKVIEVCRKRGIVGIYRFFIKDTISYNQSLDIGRRLRPSYVEILPSSCHDLIPDIKEQLSCDVLVGGLIKSTKTIDKCVDQGAIAITSSDISLWNYSK